MESRDSILRSYYGKITLPCFEDNDLYFYMQKNQELAGNVVENKEDIQQLLSISPCITYFICLICLDEGTINNLSYQCPNTFGISTQEDRIYHRGICVDCIQLYLISSINSAHVNGNGSIRCICPDRTCSYCYDREFILSKIESDPHLRQKYEQFTLNAYVEEDKQLRWCPRQGCESIVTLPSDLQHRAQVQCQNCRKSFCSSCGNVHSSFSPCSMSVEKDFIRWKSTTPSEGCRKCPSCRMYIEKDGGCRHVTCSHCQFEFCWNCKSKWINNNCSSGHIGCQVKWFWQHPSWGHDILQRSVMKTISLPIVATATGICVGAGLAISIISTPLMIVWCIQRYKRKKWIEQNQRHALDLILDDTHPRE